MKSENYSLIAAAEFTPPCSSIRTRVSLASVSQDNEVAEAIALWDTGSTYCGISSSMVERLKLKSVSTVKIRYGNGQIGEEKRYPLRVTFQPSGRVAVVYATEFTDDSQDFIVGMDIIGVGCFLLERKPDGGTKFTYSISE